MLELLLAEFNVPLDNVKQYTDRLSDSLAKVRSLEQFQEYLQGLEEGSNHVTRLVEDFIMLVELRTGETVDWFKLKSRPTGANYVLHSAGTRLQSGYDWLEVEIRYNLVAGDDEVLFDPQLLGKCLERLVEVVLGACPRDMPVKMILASTAEGEYVLLQVGSPDAVLDSETVSWLNDALNSRQVFVPGLSDFNLALVLVKGIIHYHGGALSVQSGPGHGLTYVVSLPAYKHVDI